MRSAAGVLTGLLKCVVKTQRLEPSSFSQHVVLCRHMSSKVREILLKTDRLHDHEDHSKVESTYKSIMRKVPQPVVVVTTALQDKETGDIRKRGMTCTSFTSVSFSPPIVSICIKNPSKMHDILLQTEKFAIHVLAKHQVTHGMTFAKPTPEDECQFVTVPHHLNDQNVPIILGSCAVVECTAHSVHTVGDHHVWYGEVHDAHIDEKVSDAMLYHYRSFRSVGDEIFLQSFEDATLPFENWTHEAHLRMAWNYIQEFGKAGAEPHIKSGIQKYNEQNKEKIQWGYSETITMFYTHMVADACNHTPKDVQTFEQFLMHNGHLLDGRLMYKYYSEERVYSEKAKKEFLIPDKKNLPSL